MLYWAFLFVTGWEVSRPKEAIQANAAWARRQTSGGRRGRTATLEPGQSSGRGAMGRLDFSSSTEGAAGWADVVRRTRQRRRGEYKISNLFYLEQNKPWDKLRVTQHQHWVLKCISLTLVSPRHTHAVFTPRVNDAFISKQGRLCERALPFLCYSVSAFDDGRVAHSVTQSDTVQQIKCSLLRLS